MTRQQRFKKLVTELHHANNNTDDHPEAHRRYEKALRDLAWFAAAYEDKITVASDPPKRKRRAKH